MTEENFDLIRSHLHALDALLKPGDSASFRGRVLEVRRLCRFVSELLDDNCCREKMDFIELYAADLFSELRRARERSIPARIEVLERKIQGCMSSIEAQLTSGEKAAVA